MASLKTIQEKGVLIDNFSKGRYSNQKMSSLVVPQDSVSNSFNVELGKVIAAGVVRDGTTVLGDTVAQYKSPLGLNNFVGSGGTPDIILGAFQGASQGSVYYFNGNSWNTSNITHLNNINRVRFANLGNRVYLANGEQMYSSSDGATWDFTNCPNYDNTGGIGNFQITSETLTNQIVDSYSETNVDGYETLYAGGQYHRIEWGQTFSCTVDTTITSSDFYIYLTGSPSGSVYARIYNITGAFGTNAVPTGTPLATSDAIVATNISTGASLVSFTFSGTNQIVLKAGTNYAVTIYMNSGSSSDYLNIGRDGSAQSHPGNEFYYKNGVWYNASDDLAFYVYGTQTLNQSGTGYSVNDVLTVSGGGGNAQFKVTSITGSGIVNGVSIQSSGSGYSVANAVGVTGGGGSDFKLDILSLANITAIYPTLIFKTKGTLLVAGDSASPDTVYFSSVIDPSLTPPLVWNTDPTNGNWIRVNPDDGGNLTGFAEISTNVLIFKNTGMYRIDTVAKTVDPDLIFPVGAYSQEGITSCQDKVFYFGGVGIYETDGTYPQLVSRVGFQDFLEAIPQYNWSKVALGADEFNVYVSIGTVTVKGVTYTNVVGKYSLLDASWSVHYYADYFQFFTNYTTIADGRILVGADIDGDVQTLNKGGDDNGTPIFYSLDTQTIYMGAPAYLKKISNRMVIFSDNSSDSFISVQADDDDFKNIKTTLDKHTKIGTDINAEGYGFVFRWSGVRQGNAPILYGYFLDSVDYQGVLEK